MAKKGPRILIAFKCSVCGSQNYISQKNRTTTTEKLSLKKYCKVCRQHTLHKETTKLK
ncbi:TPA: 50S ribosomal protein L33 [Candidatus Beckwithbacteria bacterium]|nr:MAG: 50S ribosomal protein L33, large subunit ribosomal protein L33 [Candidatus Beckwithbacteria bacterium GW2011_GWC1_49_16]OGD48097.1 MAG: 50S ribosomal protein L33 [Candidatus Beckwithbacteria bacterium RIFCSPHIGHO2_01_FULL_49_39]OGD49876.1 MAG: 50S ribosomal protein L33 [Candidatus Beckwithbacteria bacterium RIFCSPHIGHO2_02_FULL_49_13]OGD50344.1 MAG: 50S ribosomal protein L33 [Candidatus Beckwithbacteria bacterium RIFCSPHIGHO2_12_FULL_49_13]OGD59112.1 MAG: 50S ribosomal protein L33 [Cand